MGDTDHGGGLSGFIGELRRPKAAYAPYPFWFLNDALEPAELRRQMLDFKQKGVDGFVAHPRIGIPESLPYLSDAYMDIMAFIVETASELDMKVILYDEGMYPSGSAHGEVVRQNPAFAAMGLCLDREGSPGHCLHRFDDGMALIQRPSGGTIRGIHWGEDDGEHGAPLAADILNAEATKLFIALTHERFYARMGKYFGNTVIGFFTDEPCPMGRHAVGCQPWTEGLAERLIARGGRLADLRALFEGGSNASCELYQALVRETLAQNYYRLLSAWCAEHGIALMGHPERSDDIDEQLWFHVPGQDLIMRRVSPEKGGIRGLDSVQGKCSADAARHMGRRRNSNECFGVCAHGGWDLPGGDLKWMIDWLLLRGVNLLIPHAFYYSLRPPRHLERPPDVGPGNIWWPHYRLISDYIKRLSWLMTGSREVASVAVLCESRAMPADEIAYLWEQQVGFHYLPVSLLKQARMEGGRLKLNDSSYSHYRPMPGHSLPLHEIGPDSDLPRDLVCAAPCPDLRVAHVEKQGQHVYLCVNEGLRAISPKVRLSIAGRLLLYDAWRDSLHAAAMDDEGWCQLHLPPCESLCLIVDQQGDFGAPEAIEPAVIDLNTELRLIAHDQCAYTKTYEARLHIPSPTGNERLGLAASDMVECCCNGTFAGVSLWNPHRLDIGPFLVPGLNTLRLVVHGSAANRYGQPVFYGMHAEDAERGSRIR